MARRRSGKKSPLTSLPFVIGFAVFAILVLVFFWYQDKIQQAEIAEEADAHNRAYINQELGGQPVKTADPTVEPVIATADATAEVVQEPTDAVEQPTLQDATAAPLTARSEPTTVTTAPEQPAPNTVEPATPAETILPEMTPGDLESEAATTPPQTATVLVETPPPTSTPTAAPTAAPTRSGGLAEALANADVEPTPLTAIEMNAMLNPTEAPQDVRIQEYFAGVPGLVSWGDSLTAGAGGGGTTYAATLSERLAKFGVTIPVVNMGVGIEDTKTILSRAGALTVQISKAVSLPAGTEPVQIEIMASDGSTIAPLRQGSGGMSNVEIAGIPGTLSIEQESFASEAYAYYFSRTAEGQGVTVSVGEPVINDGSLSYRAYAPILWIGQHGDWETPEDLIAQQQMMLDAYGQNPERYLILGLTSGTAEERAELESAMQAQWGEHYINLRAYLSSEETLKALGIEYTEADKAEMAQGLVPSCLRVDSVHFTAAGYKAIGNYLFDRLDELSKAM